MDGLNSLTKWVKTKVSNLIVKAINNADINISPNGGLPTVNVDTLEGHTINDAVYPQQYGLYSAPEKGGQVLLVHPNGSTDETIILVMSNDKYFPSNEEISLNDVILKYTDTHKIHIQETGITILVENSQPITLEAKDVKVELETGGQFSVNGSNFTVDA